jgi:hypothetical protein
MDASERGALMLVRFIALGLIGWSVAELALYVVGCRLNHADVQITKCVVRSLPLLAGLAVLVNAKKLAGWISNILDD